MCCGYLLILVCRVLCMSYGTLGNIGLLGHIYRLRTPLFLKENYHISYLSLTRVLKKRRRIKKKACQYSQRLSGFKIINSVFLTTDTPSFINAGYALHLHSPLQYLKRKPRHSPGGSNQIYIMMLLNYSKQWISYRWRNPHCAKWPFQTLHLSEQ